MTTSTATADKFSDYIWDESWLKKGIIVSPDGGDALSGLHVTWQAR